MIHRVNGVRVTHQRPNFGRSREPQTKPEPFSLDCKHRSKEFATQGCQTCRGSVQIKVFQCDKFGECSISGRVGKSCEQCIREGGNA
jgi:hypothetical protein